MMQPPSPFAGIHKLLFAVLIIGAVAAFALSGSDLANPITNTLKALGLTGNNGAKVEQVDNAVLIQKIIDQQNQAAAQAAKEKDLALRSQAQAQRFQELSNTIAAEATRLFNFAVIGAISIFTIALSVVMVQFAHSRLILAQAQIQAKPQVQVKATSRWQNRAWREKKIKLARQNEQAMRASTLENAHPVYIPPFYTNEEELISWEDIRRQFKNPKHN